MPTSAVKPAEYEALLASKVAATCAVMAPFSPPAPDVFRSQSTGFRQRAEFRIWHDGDRLDYVMFRRDAPKTPVVITLFPIAAPCIQAMMPLLHEALNANTVLRQKLFQVEFLTGLSGELIITLIYHRKLDETWESEAHLLLERLQSTVTTLSVIGRSRKQKLIIGKDFIEEVLPVHGQSFHYRQYEQSFSQPNAQVNIQMIEWACNQAETLSGDLLELYCGNGNFTLPLAAHFDNVIATELSKVSIRAARASIVENNIDNVQLLRMSAEEVTQAMNAVRVFRRVSELPKSLDEYALSTLFVDPPRAGLDEDTVELARRFETIIYISCNPTSLAQNMASLNNTHRIVRFAQFDQFPYTDHMECGVILVRK